MRLVICLFLFLSGASFALAQSIGTLNIQGPSTGGPLITPSLLNAAINAQQTSKVDANGGTLTGGTLAGTVASSAEVIATGGTIARTLADRAADETNVLSFTGVDKAGATDSASGIQSAIGVACSSPQKSLFFPPGTYKLLTNLQLNSGTCPGLVMRAAPGTVTLISDASNSSTPSLLNITKQSGLTILGIIFDGNAAASAVTAHQLINITAPSDHIVLSDVVCQNAVNTCIISGNVAGITGTVNAQATAGANSLSFAGAIPTGLKAGANFYGTTDPDIYVTAASGTTATLSKNLTDTILSGATVHFTLAFQVSADILTGAVVFPTSDTTNLVVGQTVHYPGVCLPRKTRITAISVNTSVTVNQAPTCLIPSGTNFAAMAGLQDFQVVRTRFENIGMVQRTAGTLSLNTSGSTSSGTKTLVLTCVSAACAPGVGVIPGDLTAAAGMPTGMPASNLVVDGPVVNNGARTLTVTLASATTGIIADATAIPFQVGAVSGNGFAIWLAQGAWFANRDIQLINNTFRHAWSSAVFIQNTENTLLSDNTYNMDWMEYQNPLIAPSACIAPAFNVNMRFIGESCSGATGMGIEANHNIGMQIIGGNYSGNGRGGVYLCGGHDYMLSGVTALNNSQYLNHPLIQQFATPDNSAITLDGSCSGNQAATLSNVVITGLAASDTQATPTQAWAIARGRSQGTLSGISISNIVATGNTSGAIGLQPVLTSCGGGSPALDATATDSSGTITEGTSSVGCILTFAVVKNAAPHCAVTSSGGSAFTSYSTSTTALTIVNGTASGAKYDYQCSSL